MKKINSKFNDLLNSGKNHAVSVAKNETAQNKKPDIYRILIDEFDKELNDDNQIAGQDLSVKSEETELKDKLKNANIIIGKLVEKLSRNNNQIIKQYRTENSGEIGLKISLNPEAEKHSFTIDDEPLILRPATKTEGIFNDVNLTEDYELGMRFYQMGLKTGFFNIKLDSGKESTRIATAEFFPNKFWPAVKQRSRWIAGICLQNWKAHKWNGNLITKYFLFRDRKPLISFWSTFTSNLIMLYFIYLGISAAFGADNSLITGNIHPALWFLMMFNLVFMISKVIHRFIFTSGWYGAKYGFASIFRLVIDSFINMFAIVRSISVFRKTKEKVVWDATTHY